MRYPLCLLLTLALFCFRTDQTNAQNIAQHLAAGEFGVAMKVAEQAPARERDPILAQIASAQGSTGQSVAATETLRGIQSPAERMDAIQGARGGGSFADFQSLIQLIQTTVVPDTWEALGGPSTMAEYPGGIFVDASGTLQACQTFADNDAAANLRALLNGNTDDALAGGEAWRRPSRLRSVSLRRLMDHLTEQKMQRTAAGDAALHLGGLSEIRYVFITADDIVLAGPVGGIETVQGWHRDRTTGLSTIRSDFLFTCLASAMGNQSFGCTIDPTPEGLQRAAAVSAAIGARQIPIGKAAEHMKTALGMQRVEVFGTAGDTPIGYLMVEADRHMKQLALGEAEMPEGVKNYLDIIDESIDKGPPNELLLRLWFTATPRSVRADAERTVFEIGGSPMHLSGENQRALANGQRGNVAVDFRTDAFVDHFNRHWADIRTKYPVYAALESVYQAASIAELLDRHAESEQLQALLQTLAAESTSSQWLMPAPRQVESIAKHHTVRHGRTIHHVVVASGGVAVKSSETLKPQLIDYPSLAAIAKPADSQPRVIQRWWWDASN